MKVRIVLLLLVLGSVSLVSARLTIFSRTPLDLTDQLNAAIDASLAGCGVVHDEYIPPIVEATGTLETLSLKLYRRGRIAPTCGTGWPRHRMMRLRALSSGLAREDNRGGALRFAKGVEYALWQDKFGRKQSICWGLKRAKWTETENRRRDNLGRLVVDVWYMLEMHPASYFGQLWQGRYDSGGFLRRQEAQAKRTKATLTEAGWIFEAFQSKSALIVVQGDGRHRTRQAHWKL